MSKDKAFSDPCNDPVDLPLLDDESDSLNLLRGGRWASSETSICCFPQGPGSVPVGPCRPPAPPVDPAHWLSTILASLHTHTVVCHCCPRTVTLPLSARWAPRPACSSPCVWPLGWQLSADTHAVAGRGVWTHMLAPPEWDQCPGRQLMPRDPPHMWNGEIGISHYSPQSLKMSFTDS